MIGNPAIVGAAAGWYPFVGLAIGVSVALANTLLHLFFPSLITAALTLTLWVILTGGLHLDGLADCCDGLLHASNPEKRLEIMKDSRMGAFAGIGLTLTLLLKFSALASLLTDKAVPVILLAASLGRWFIIVAGFQPLARPGGKVPGAPARDGRDSLPACENQLCFGVV